MIAYIAYFAYSAKFTKSLRKVCAVLTIYTLRIVRYDKGTTKKAADQGKEENTMTNEQIIFNESINLMEQGKLNGTGNMITITTVNADGQKEKKQIEEPEPIHTYAAWKQLGFQVKKGSKAVTQINIWKHVSRKEEIEVKYTDGTTGTEEVDNSKMFMKLSSFFSLSQVERIQTA